MSEGQSPQPRLRILQVLEPSGGGSGRHFLDLCGTLNQRGHRVTAIYSPLRAETRFVDELSSLGLDAAHPVAMTRAPGPSDFTAWKAIQRVARAQGPFDIIHGHSSKAGALTRLRLPGHHVPRVYTPHAFRTMDPTLGRGGRLAFGLIEAGLGRFASDAIICVSRDEYAHALSLGIPEKQLSLIVNGVVPPPSGQRSALREKFGIPDDAVVFGFIGRLSAQKAPERLVNAFARIALQRPDAWMLMIGSGELQAGLLRRIAGTGFDDRIILDADLPGAQAVQCFDALVMPSRYEAMSYVALEAAAAGLPLILTDVGGASTVLKHGDNGILVANSDDTEALADAMSMFCDPAQRSSFAAKARLRMQQYSLATMVDHTENLYQRLAVAQTTLRP